MFSRRSVLAAGSLAGLTSVLPTSACAAPATKAPDGLNTNPDAYDWLAIYKQFLASLAADGVSLAPVVTAAPTAPVVTTYGAKSAAVKAAIKGAIKVLVHIGKKAWEKALGKAPLPGAVKKYLGYETVLKALNIATNFEGTIDDAIAHGLQQVGVPHWAAGIAARAITTILL